MELHCRLPRLFIQDREERALPTARFGPFKGNIAVCWPERELAEEMLSDALYQWDGTDAEDLAALRRSAKRAADILTATLAVL